MCGTSSIVLTIQDYERLSKFLRLTSFRSIRMLAEKLANAELVPQKQMPRDIVTMNSVIHLMDLDTHEQRSVALVYPFQDDSTSDKISILSPIGVEVLGLRVGELLQWQIADDEARNFKISRLIFQPEAFGAWDL